MQVFNPAIYSFTFYALPPLVVGLMTAVLGWAVFIRERKSATNLAFINITTAVSVWLLIYVAIYSTRDEAAALWWCRLENVAVIFIPASVYLFTQTVVGKSQRSAALAGGIFAATFLFLTLNVFTPLFVAGLYRYPWGYYARYGVGGILFLIFFFAVMLKSLWDFRAEYKRHAPGIKKRRLRAFFIAFGVGYLGSIDFLPVFGLPILPVGYLPIFIFVLLMARAIWRYKLVDITPSYAAEQIIKTMADALLVMDQEGIVRVANQAASDLFGVPMKEFVGKPISVVPIDFFKKEKLARLICTGTVQNHEVLFEKRERGKIILDISSSVLRDEAGDPMAIVCISKDITVRKQSEQALRESEQRYRLLAENITDVIWIMNPEMKLAYISPSVKYLRGFTAEEAIAQTFEQSVTPASFKAAMTVLAEELSREKTAAEDAFHSRTLEFEYYCKDGSTVLTEVKMTVLHNASGRPMKILGVARDIRARRKTEETLRESERCYEELIRETSEPIISFDRLGYLQSINPAAEVLLGSVAVELVGKHIGKAGIFTPDSAARTLQEFTLVLLGWQRPPFEVHLIQRGQTCLTMEAHPQVIKKEKGNARLQIFFRPAPSKPLAA